MITEFNQDRKRVFRIEPQPLPSTLSISKVNNNNTDENDKEKGSTLTEQKTENESIDIAPVSINNIKITSDSYAEEYFAELFGIHNKSKANTTTTNKDANTSNLSTSVTPSASASTSASLSLIALHQALTQEQEKEKEKQQLQHSLLNIPTRLIHLAFSSSVRHEIWRQINKKIQHLFLPEGYPRTVTHDLLPVARWEFIQQIAGCVTSTMATRSLLLNAGVGKARANLASATTAWILRDGMKLLISVLFAARVSVNLDHRCKTWRMIADLCHGSANCMELCSIWLPCGSLLRTLWIMCASSVRAVVGVAGQGTRASWVQHFAKVGNAADIAAKRGNRENAGSFIGLTLATFITYFTPPANKVRTLNTFIVFVLIHAFSNYKAITSTMLNQLNAPRLEYCMEAFYTKLEREVQAIEVEQTNSINNAQNNKIESNELLSDAPKTVTVALSSLNALQKLERLRISARRANTHERLFLITPISPCMSMRFLSNADTNLTQNHKVNLKTLLSSVLGSYAQRSIHIVAYWIHFAQRHMTSFLPQMRVRIIYGASLYDVFTSSCGAAHLNQTSKHEIIRLVEEALSVRDVAMVYDAEAMTYYVLFAEQYANDGTPMSWQQYQMEMKTLKLAMERKEQEQKHQELHKTGTVEEVNTAAVNNKDNKKEEIMGVDGKTNKMQTDTMSNNHHDTTDSNDNDEDENSDKSKSDPNVNAPNADDANNNNPVIPNNNTNNLNDIKDIKTNSLNINPLMQSSTSSMGSSIMAHSTAGAEQVRRVQLQLWAYFYAYSHQRALGFPLSSKSHSSSVRANKRNGNNNNNNIVIETNHTQSQENAKEPSSLSVTLSKDENTNTIIDTSPLFVITSLNADGTLINTSTLNKDGHSSPSSNTNTNTTAQEPIIASLAEQHPEDILHVSKSSEAEMHSSQRRGRLVHDGLYPYFVTFERTLQRSGWHMERLLLPNKGWTVSIHHV